MARKKEGAALCDRLCTAAARDSIAQVYRLLARLTGLVERVSPTEAVAVARELILSCERLGALAAYLERLSSDETQPAPAEQPVAAGAEAAPSS